MESDDVKKGSQKDLQAKENKSPISILDLHKKEGQCDLTGHEKRPNKIERCQK